MAFHAFAPYFSSHDGLWRLVASKSSQIDIAVISFIWGVTYREIQKVRFSIYSRWKDSFIELASMGSVGTYIHHLRWEQDCWPKDSWVPLLHDNARPHSDTATLNLLNSWGWEILPHPPYSPDLAPSDFHLVFPKMKKHLRGQRFRSNEDVQNEVKKCLPAQDAFLSMKDLTNWYIAMISV
jgi:transposase